MALVQGFRAGSAAIGLLGLALAACSSSDPSASAHSAGGQTNAGSSSGSSAANTSPNWAGYVRSGAAGSFHQVSGSWVVPAVDCSGGGSTASAAWTGIGGASASDNTLIQAGTGQDCNSGSASYYAWWETVPAPSMMASGPISNQSYGVSPGDPISVSIDGNAAALWTITIHNANAGWTFSTTVPFSGTTASAEWIMEAPLQAGTSSAGQATLSQFSRIGFSGLSANGAAAGLNSGEAVSMTDAQGKVQASPSSPLAGGTGFDVCRGAGACP